MTSLALPGPRAVAPPGPREDDLVSVVAGSNRIALTRLRPMFAPGGLQHGLMLAVIALFPFQILGLDVGTTKVDLANVAFVLFVATIALSNRGFAYTDSFKLFLGVYLATEAIMFFAGPTTPARFASALLWLTSIFILFGRRDHVPINARLAYWLTLAGVGVVALSMIYGYVFEGQDRPRGVMAEPSPAALVLLAATTGFIISARWAPTRAATSWAIGAAVLLFGMSLVTKTTHILSFAIALPMLGLLSRSFNLRTVLLSLIVLIAFYWLFTTDSHYQSRVDIQNASANLSLLAWLQGFEQMLASIRLYPVVGAGLGATGQFDFYSVYSVDLFRAGIGDLNRQDAYCGLFRLVIELGPVLTAAVLYAIWLRLRQLWRSTGEGLLPIGTESQAQMFIFSFAVTLVIGFLLKEPTYSRSHIVLAALFLSVVPLRAVVVVPRQVAAQLQAAAA